MTPEQPRPIFDQWNHWTLLVCAGSMLNWNQTSFFYLGECKKDILSYPLRMAGWKEQPAINYSINGNDQRERVLLSIYNVHKLVQEYVCISLYP